MKAVFAVVIAALVASAFAETLFVTDLNNVREINSDTGSAGNPTIAQYLPFGTTYSINHGGLGSVTLDSTNQVFYGVSPDKHNLIKFVPQGKKWNRLAFVGTFGTSGASDGTGTSAQFNNPSDVMMWGSSGDILVADFGNKAIRKVTKDGAVSTVAGALGSAGTTDGVGTNALFTAPKSIHKAGNNYVVVDNAGVRQMTSTFDITTIAGAPGTAGTAADGLGTAAVFQTIGASAVSQDGKTMYVSEVTDATKVEAATIRKINLETGAVTTVAGSASATGDVADGMGTNAVISSIGSMYVDANGTLFFSSFCKDGSVVRKYDPNDSDKVSAVSGDYQTVTCTIGQSKGFLSSTNALATSKAGGATTAQFKSISFMTSFQEVCNKYFNFDETAVANSAECSDFGSGTVKNLKAKSGKLDIIIFLIVTGNFDVEEGGVVVFSKGGRVQGPMAIKGNSTLAVSDVDVEVDSIALESNTVYQVVTKSLNPGIIKSKGLAQLAGAFVMAIDSTFDFGVGSSATIMTFAQSSGSFAKVFLVKLRSGFDRRSERKALQSASAAQVVCGSTSCAATGVTPSADDDDEVPFIVALIVIAVLLFIGIAFAIYWSSKGKSTTVKREVASSNAPAPGYGLQGDAAYSSTSSSSSSSYIVDNAFGFDSYSY